MTWNRVSNYATNVFHDGFMMCCVYHRTAIVRWDSQKIILNSGGWQTATTKKKMNQVSNQFNLGYTVYQEDYNWYITYNNITMPFKDGMELTR